MGAVAAIDADSGVDRARMLAALWAAGCLLTTAAGVLPAWPDVHRRTLLTIAVLAGIGAAALWSGRRRLPAFGAHAGVVTGLLLIGGCIVGAGRVGGPAFAYAMVWVGCYSALFFRPRAVALHIAFATGVQALCLWHLGLGATTAPQVVMQVGVSSVAALVVGSLVARTRALAMSDPLTGLSNRRGLEGAIAHELAVLRRSAQPLSLLAIDLDRFKAVNDALGHEAGDRLLQRFAAAWSAELRAVDTAGRLGGDEFVMVLPGVDLGGAHAVAERLRAAVATDGQGVEVSIGAAGADVDDQPADLLRRADRALYEVKALHRRTATGDATSYRVPSR